MIRALYSAASGMTAQQLNVDNIANNLANSNTAGYKTRRAQFQDLLYQNMIQPGAAAGQQTVVPTGLQLGSGTRASSNEIIFTQGEFSQTSNPLDVVIQGNGFFQVLQPNGTIAYTRAGQFQLNQTGNLVDSSGNPLQPNITLPVNAQTVTIATDGTVSYTLPNQTAAQTAGQIQLATFANPAGLNSLGQNYYQPTTASGEPILGTPGGQEGLGTLLQGYTEQSNVSVVNEFVNLIISQRAYEANSKVVKAADEMYQEMNNLTR
jgi:flagellar basal-body rod protein FlgG